MQRKNEIKHMNSLRSFCFREPLQQTRRYSSGDLLPSVNSDSPRKRKPELLKTELFGAAKGCKLELHQIFLAL